MPGPAQREMVPVHGLPDAADRAVAGQTFGIPQ